MRRLQEECKYVYCSCPVFLGLIGSSSPSHSARPPPASYSTQSTSPSPPNHPSSTTSRTTRSRHRTTPTPSRSHRPVLWTSRTPFRREVRPTTRSRTLTSCTQTACPARSAASSTCRRRTCISPIYRHTCTTRMTSMDKTRGRASTSSACRRRTRSSTNTQGFRLRSRPGNRQENSLHRRARALREAVEAGAGGDGAGGGAGGRGDSVAGRRGRLVSSIRVSSAVSMGDGCWITDV